MPTSPELLRVLTLVRTVEVHRQIESHQHRDTDGDIGITGEVGIDLQRVGKQRKQVLKSREQKRIIEDTVNQVHRQIIGHDDLLRQTVQYPEYRNPESPAT